MAMPKIIHGEKFLIANNNIYIYIYTILYSCVKFKKKIILSAQLSMFLLG